jgi:seryl-tRNA synthetase
VENLLTTAAGTCYRNELRYEGLRRLGAFRMREVVAIGDPDHASAHLARFTTLIMDFADRLGLPMQRQAANDPFFDAAAPQAVWQSIVPVKHEFVVDGLAIASVNEHHTFFGERCAIRRAGANMPVSSSCAAFGLERWISVLVDRFDGDWDSITDAVRTSADNHPGTIHQEVR